MSKIKDSFIDEEPVGYKHVVFSKLEESKLQKYLQEIDEIKKCWECGAKLHMDKSRALGNCNRCRQKAITIDRDVNYPRVDSLSDMNNYLGL